MCPENQHYPDDWNSVLEGGKVRGGMMMHGCNSGLSRIYPVHLQSQLQRLREQGTMYHSLHVLCPRGMLTRQCISILIAPT